MFVNTRVSLNKQKELKHTISGGAMSSGLDIFVLYLMLSVKLSKFIDLVWFVPIDYIWKRRSEQKKIHEIGLYNLVFKYAKYKLITLSSLFIVKNKPDMVRYLYWSE